MSDAPFIYRDASFAETVLDHIVAEVEKQLADRGHLVIL